MREVKEETGLTSADMTGLELKYIILRIKLSWIDIKLADELNVTATTRLIFKHFSENKNSSKIYVGTMKSVGSEPEITWALLEDWEKNKVSHLAIGYDSWMKQIAADF